MKFSFSFFSNFFSKLPSFSQFKQLPKVLNKKEYIILVSLAMVAIVSFAFLAASVYIGITKPLPKFGGEYKEGIVGQPRFINPIYADAAETDRTLTDLIFAGLMSYDENGRLKNDLIKEYGISEDGKNYEIQLKENVFWHDGKPLTADDVIFTIKTIQNPSYNSPLRANWIDVDVEKTSEHSLIFKLKSPYNSFPEILTVKILPSHIWRGISSDKFALSPYNLQPIGAGPFKFSKIKYGSRRFIESIELQSNRKYHNSPSYISNLTFVFFETENSLVRAAEKKDIDGFTLPFLGNEQGSIAQKSRFENLNRSFTVYSFKAPRYFAVFFKNQRNSIFADKDIRKAAILSVNKQELVKSLNNNFGVEFSLANSPVLPDFYGWPEPSTNYGFDIEQAKTLLDKAGYKENNEGKREKVESKQSALQFKSYLKIGSKGEEVSLLQNCLSSLPDSNFSAFLADETKGTYGEGTGDAVTVFQEKYLPEFDSTGETGPSTRKKLNEICASSNKSEVLEFTLTVLDQPLTRSAAQTLSAYWNNAGIQVNIKTVSAAEIAQIIKSRDYQALLYGQALGSQPDLFSFWHSSQRVDPGLNLAFYSKERVDELIKRARETLDEEEKKQALAEMQNIILDDAPALFLFSPDYMYHASPKVKGIDTIKIIDPAKRFSNVTGWHIKTKRVFNF